MMDYNDSLTTSASLLYTTVYQWDNTTVPTNSTSPVKVVVGVILGLLKKLPIPLWASIILAILALILLCVICICICKCCCCRKKKPKARGDTVDIGKFSGSTYHDKVQPDLLLPNMEEEYTESTYSEAKPGKLEVSLDFDFSKNELQVGVLQALDLPSADADGMSDPYVRLFFDSNKKHKFETKVHKKTLSPVFNEYFTFLLPYTDLINETLIFAIYDFNRIMKHTLMGLVKIPMKTINFKTVYTGFRDVTSPELEHESDDGQLGDVCFSLRYVPTSGKLTVVILEAKNLRKMDDSGLSDPYVKISMFIGKKLAKKKKTSIKKKTVTPYYNEQFTFDVLPKDVENVTLHIAVVDYDRFGRSEPIGHVLIGRDTEMAQKRHWEDMLKFPRRPIAQWHSLVEIPKRVAGGEKRSTMARLAK